VVVTARPELLDWRPGWGTGQPNATTVFQALIAARLDTLAPEHKTLLQDAAVFGQVLRYNRWG
jgi:hypothetical protein